MSTVLTLNIEIMCNVVVHFSLLMEILLHKLRFVKVDLQKTIEGCERILSGEFNYLSENDFFMVGDIDEVIAKTRDKKEAYEKAMSEENG